jgi:hypothetical protein
MWRGGGQKEKGEEGCVGWVPVVAGVVGENGEL